MKLLIALLASSLLSMVQAQEVVNDRFHFSHLRSFYSCHFAENRADQILQALGAENIVSRCQGGLEMRQRFVSVLVDFEVPNHRGPWRNVILNERTFDRFSSENSCEFTYRMIQQFIENFAVRNLTSFNGCWDGRGRFQFEFQLRQEE